MPTVAPPAPYVLASPAHLAGPGEVDIAYELAAEFGWYRPYYAPTSTVLISDQEGLALLREDRQWNLVGPGWQVRFCDRAPAEVSLAILREADATEAALALPGPRIVGHRATAALLSAGWSAHDRDGYHLVAAPDRRAALSFPFNAPDPTVMLTGAAQKGVWTVQFSPTAPDALLTTAATTLLTPVQRRPEQLPERARARLSTTVRTSNGPADRPGRSAAACARGSSSISLAGGRAETGTRAAAERASAAPRPPRRR